MGLNLVKIFFYFWIAFQACYWALGDFLLVAQGGELPVFTVIGQIAISLALFFVGRWAINRYLAKTATEIDSMVKEKRKKKK